ncbi:verprolin-like [Myotis myotis]|uniref:verprolin-like n=1 Tax=Myotis myotis TaxID=51298 RepID=UPI00174AEF33|nr:verprolin-like [Myotis myotis]
MTAGTEIPRILLPEGRSSLPRGAWTQAPRVPPAPLPLPQRSPRLRVPAAAANATRQPWQRPKHGAARRQPLVLRGRRRLRCLPHPGYLSGHRSAPPTLSAAARAIPQFRSRPRPLPPPPWAGTGLCTWFMSEEMEKLISGASTGSGWKRAVQAQRKAPRGRGGGKRSSGKTSDRPTGVAGRGERRPGIAGTRSLARWLVRPRGSSRRRNCAPQLRQTDLHARPGDTAAAAPLARASPPRTSPRAPPPPPPPPPTLRGRSGSSLSANHRRAPARGGSRPRPPRPASRSRSRSRARFPCSAAQVGQRKVIPARETLLRVRLRFLMAPGSLLPSPRTRTLARPLALPQNWLPPASSTCSVPTRSAVTGERQRGGD